MANALILHSFGTDTSDATATENDILKDVTAYTAKGKVEGTIPILNRNYDIGFDSIVYSVTDGLPAWRKSNDKFTHIGGSSIWESGGYITPGTAVEIFSPVADFIEKFEITSDKIAEGQNILGVEGIAKIATDIPSGSQTFTANGTFTAPYAGVYTVIVTAPVAAGGRGGSGMYDEFGGGGGGAGGSAYIADTPFVGIIQLDESESVTVTINTSISSFGSYMSFSAGSAGGQGNSGGGTSGRGNGYGGSGGTAGTKPTYSATSNAKVIYVSNPTIITRSLSGGQGGALRGGWGKDFDGYDYGGNIGGVGGVPAADRGNPGGGGGTGSSYFGADQGSYMRMGSTSYTNGSSAKTGAIQIIYGNYKGVN